MTDRQVQKACDRHLGVRIVGLRVIATGQDAALKALGYDIREVLTDPEAEAAAQAVHDHATALVATTERHLERTPR